MQKTYQTVVSRSSQHGWEDHRRQLPTNSNTLEGLIGGSVVMAMIISVVTWALLSM